MILAIPYVHEYILAKIIEFTEINEKLGGTNWRLNDNWAAKTGLPLNNARKVKVGVIFVLWQYSKTE